jgi:hypothetical protein
MSRPEVSRSGSLTDLRRRESAPRTEISPGPTGPDPRRWKALMLLCVTNFMIILDAQIIILALPSIEKDPIARRCRCAASSKEIPWSLAGEGWYYRAG